MFKRHAISHLAFDDAPFRCNVCHRAFGVGRELRRHCEKDHQHQERLRDAPPHIRRNPTSEREWRKGELSRMYFSWSARDSQRHWRAVKTARAVGLPASSARHLPEAREKSDEGRNCRRPQDAHRGYRHSPEASRHRESPKRSTLSSVVVRPRRSRRELEEGECVSSGEETDHSSGLSDAPECQLLEQAGTESPSPTAEASEAAESPLQGATEAAEAPKSPFEVPPTAEVFEAAESPLQGATEAAEAPKSPCEVPSTAEVFEAAESPLQGATEAAEAPKSPFEVPPTAEASEAAESPLQGATEAAEAPKSPFEVPPLAEAFGAAESPLQGATEAAEAPKSPFEVPPTAEAFEAAESPLQGATEAAEAPKSPFEVPPLAEAFEVAESPLQGATEATEAPKSPFEVSPTAEAVVAPEAAESPLQGETTESARPEKVEADRNPEAGDAYPIFAQAVTCPPIYLEISDEEMPTANENQGTLSSYHPAPAPELMDSPMPEDIPAPAVAAMIRLMGAAPHTSETPDVHSLLEGQKRNEALIISLQYQVVRLEEELREARKEAKADREGYEGIIDDLLSRRRRRRRHTGKDNSPSSPSKRRRWFWTNGPLIRSPCYPECNTPTNIWSILPRTLMESLNSGEFQWLVGGSVVIFGLNS